MGARRERERERERERGSAGDGRIDLTRISKNADRCDGNAALNEMALSAS